MAGSVTSFTLSPDGATAVYIADQETVGLFELYSTPVDALAAPTKISAGLLFGPGDEGVTAFRISPDGTQVVFLADPDNGGGGSDIFSVPIPEELPPHPRVFCTSADLQRIRADIEAGDQYTLDVVERITRQAEGALGRGAGAGVVRSGAAVVSTGSAGGSSTSVGSIRMC